MKSTLGMVLALLTLLELTFSSQVAFAANEITRLVPFQGRLHGGDNKIVSDGVYDVSFYIYATPTGGTKIWSETHSNVSVIHGYVNVLLGAIKPMVTDAYAEEAPLYDESESLVNFAQQKYLGISINGGAEMFPRSQLVPTFHAYTANHATHATQADNADTATHATHADNADNANNANKLGGKNADFYISAEGSNLRFSNLENKFSGTKAKNADKLDDLDSTKFMRSTTANGHPGITLPGGSTANWLRTTTNGLLPYQSGGSSSIGNSSWNFTNVFATNIYDGNVLLENKYLGKGAKAADANLLDNVNSLSYARTDLVEVFDKGFKSNGQVRIEHHSTSLGKNGAGNTALDFFDDNSDTNRTIHWSDTGNTFYAEGNDGVHYPFLKIKVIDKTIGDDLLNVDFKSFPQGILGGWVQVLSVESHEKGNEGAYGIALHSFKNDAGGGRGSAKIDRHNAAGGIVKVKIFLLGI